ncbi:hypothetical protein FRC15_001923 [Serendipita sp. 397]|nr:hypothetical protein FRC15_001923 [Serendipita sp. 397]
MQEYSVQRMSINKGRPISFIAEDPKPIEETHLTPSPISRYPDCLLVPVFELVAEEGSHNILPLLSVNKRFHQVAMSNPTLWRKIFIKINGHLSEINSLSASYVKLSLERGKETLLDVVLDCDDIAKPFNFMRGYIYNLVCNAVVDEVDRRDLRTHLDKEFTEQDGFYDYPGWEFPFYKRRLELALVIIRSLITSGQAHAHRWRSAVITFSGIDDIQDTILELFKSKMPNLRSFEGTMIPFNKSGNTLWPSLRELAISTIVDLSLVPVNFPLLTTFKFHHHKNRENLSDLAILSQCTALQELSIYCEGGTFPGVPRLDANLPMLISLSLEGNVRSIGYVRFNSPKLERWNLTCKPSKALPEVHAPHVKWVNSDYGSRSSLDSEMYFLRLLLTTFKKTASFTAEGLAHPKPCFAEICNMKAAKKLPDCLRTIEIMGAGAFDLAVDT